MSEITPITVAYGDGIGPEIMQAVLHILMKAEAKIRVEVVEVRVKQRRVRLNHVRKQVNFTDVGQAVRKACIRNVTHGFLLNG